MGTRSRLRLFAFIAAALAMATMPSEAAMKIISSNAPAHKAGDVLQSDATLNIPGGASVKAIDTATGVTVRYSGPYSGPLSKYRTPSSDCPGCVVGGTRGIMKQPPRATPQTEPCTGRSCQN